MSSYPPRPFSQSDFVAPARRYPALWRLILGVLTALAVYIATIAGLAALAHAILGDAQATQFIASVQSGGTPQGTLWMLVTFVGMALGAVAAALWHWRGPMGLLGPLGRTARHFAVALVIAAVLLGASVGVYLISHSVIPAMPFAVWLGFVPVALLALALQTGAEELLFRGYLQSQLGARFSSPWVWLVLPSVLFGALHFDPNQSAGIAALVVLAATVFGLCAADLTARTGSLGAAWGFHMANNAAAFLLISLPDSRSGLSLYLTPFSFADTQIVIPMILQDIATTVVIWLAIRTALKPRQAGM